MGDSQLTLLSPCEMKQETAVLVKVSVCVCACCCCRTSAGQCECASVGKRTAERSQSALAGRWDVYLCEQAHARLFVDSPELAETLLVVVEEEWRRWRGNTRVCGRELRLQFDTLKPNKQGGTSRSEPGAINGCWYLSRGECLRAHQSTHCRSANTHTHMHEAGCSNRDQVFPLGCLKEKLFR